MVFTNKIYPEWMKEVQEKKYDDLFLDFILPIQQELDLSTATVLDVGINRGWFEDKLFEKGVRPQVVGIDVEVGGKSGILMVKGDGNFLPFKDSSFDVVVSIDTVHLIRSKWELTRVLRGGGFLLVSEFCNQYNAKQKREGLVASFRGLRVLKEGAVGGKELAYAMLFRKS